MGVGRTATQNGNGVMRATPMRLKFQPQEAGARLATRARREKPRTLLRRAERV